MKTEPSKKIDSHYATSDASERGSDTHGEAGSGTPKGMEYDKDGKEMKGGGYYKKGGTLYKMGPYKKSDDLSGEDLQKSLELLEDFANEGNTPSRKESLLAKAQSEEGLSKSENAELFEILGGGEASSSASPAKDPISKALTDNEPLRKALDVSEYLEEQHGALVKSLDAVGDAIEKSDTRRHEFAMLQAKATVDIGNLVKSMAVQLGVIAEQPAAGPKSKGVRGGTKVLNKSMVNGDSEELQLNKGMVMDTMEEMSAESLEKGWSGRLAGGTGEDIGMALTKYESLNQISPTMLKAVKDHRQQIAQG